MSRLALGLISGLVFGGLVVAMMLPMTFPDKRAALAGAFLNRFGIGVILGALIGSPQLTSLGLSGWLIGGAVGLLLSLPDAIITKAYAPILIIGTIGSAVIGWVITRWGIA
jgi:hypothetical protein